MTSSRTPRIVLADTKPAAAAVDALVVALVPARGKKVEVVSPGLTPAARTKLAEAFAAIGATAKSGDVARLPGGGTFKATTVVGLGLGAPDRRSDAESLRKAVGSAIRSLAGIKKVALALPLDDEDSLLHVAIAAQLAAYEFTTFRGAGSTAHGAAQRTFTILLDAPVTPEQKEAVRGIGLVASSVNLARDLVNTPPNALPPAALADAARTAVADLPVEVIVWDEHDLLGDGCGGILAVGQGSANPPRLVRLDYAPAGATRHLALVGKGITFDTGGISIKPAASMDEMKADMAGAAAVIGAVQAIAELQLNVRVTGWVPAAENMPGGAAQRPGDVITMFGGTTVEVLNTDAEGRLVLADALGLAIRESPDLIIDAATLTGAQRIALGTRTAGVMSNSDAARTAVCEAADRAGELMWPMPLPDDLRQSLESSTADIANIGERLGGMLTAGVFLNEFVPPTQPWVHIDMAGPAFNDKGAYGYTPKGGTGATVRTFVQVAAEMAAGSL
ncbi:MAG: leucyl aminopeptidase [Actinomycetota bacterium]|nr:leucyl aminopeptidase [Actinomycetota bacterium]